MKKRLLHLLCLSLLTALFAAAGVMRASACTAVYVGREASDDGTVILAKSNDYQDVWANYAVITGRVENEPGRTMPVDNDATVFAPIPATTFRYTSTPWMPAATAANGLGSDAAVCTNECGVTMLMSITAFSNQAALAADPTVEHGLSEFTAVDLVTCQSASAREAVEVLLSLIDTYGSSEVNIALIADRSEAWYVEMYNGHQYAAVRLPDSAVCAFGNEFSLEYVSDYADCILSPGLESLAAENGFAVYGRNGELNLLQTYSGASTTINYSHMRTWIAHRLLAPSQYGEYEADGLYPLCFVPDERVSLSSVLQLLRNRFEGTQYSPDETGRTDMRVIGTETALSVHAVQIYPDLPADMACVTWESSGPAVYGVFVPISNACLRISEAYGRCQSADEAGSFDTGNYPYYRFKALTTLCSDSGAQSLCGTAVRAYWQAAETAMIDGMRSVLEKAASMDRSTAARYITDYCCAMQTKAFEDAGTILNSVLWYLSKNSNSLKNGRNPETHEVLDERRSVAPMTLALDASAYGTLPEPSYGIQPAVRAGTYADIALVAAGCVLQTLG